jgi:predicted lipase
MDLNKAILYGQLVNAAYDVAPSDLSNKAGTTVSAGLGPNKTTFEVITSIYANDLATDAMQSRATILVSIGLLLRQGSTGESVIAIRGTEGILEWVQDAKFITVKCPFLAEGGETEDGFTDVYNSFAVSTQAGSPSVTKSLATIFGNKPVNSLTVCGHSLGGALATLQALDAAANSTFKNPSVYTYASPRTGNPQFASTYNRMVPNTFRVANKIDVVPMLPLPPVYEHVLGLNKLSPFTMFPPKILVQPNPVCEHVLPSYLHLLSLRAGGQVLPLTRISHQG